MFAGDFQSFYDYSSSAPLGSGKFAALDAFPPFSGGLDGVSRGGSSSSLVLDSVRGELVEAPPPARVAGGKKEVSEAKALAALKSHSEAERRRRERINSHLATLRRLIPSAEKMDKATLLGEVINQVKMLKHDAMEASKGLLIPMDEDELKVEPYLSTCGTPYGTATFSFKASLCCEYRSGLLSEIRQAIESLQLRLVDAEISTLGDRMKNVLILNKCGKEDGNDENGNDAQKEIVGLIHQALSSIIEKGSPLLEYSPRTMLPNKRRRMTFFDSSSSSC